MRSLDRGRCLGSEKNENRGGGAFSTSILDIVDVKVLGHCFGGEFVS